MACAFGGLVVLRLQSHNVSSEFFSPGMKRMKPTDVMNVA